MEVLKSIVIFLVGVGVAIGAHFAGLFDRIPYGWSHPGWAAADDRPPPPDTALPPADPLPPNDAIATTPLPDHDIGGPPPDHPDDEAAIEAPPPETDAPPVALHVAYFSSRGREWNDGCSPRYELVNRTGATVRFSSNSQRGADVRVDPGSSLRSDDDDGAGFDGSYGADDPATCRAGVIKIFLERP